MVGRLIAEFLQIIDMDLTHEGRGWSTMRPDQDADRQSSRPPSPGGNGETGVPTAGGGDAGLFGQRGCFCFPATPSAARLASLVGRASRRLHPIPYFRR